MYFFLLLLWYSFLLYIVSTPFEVRVFFELRVAL
jgi:hypothetical protein